MNQEHERVLCAIERYLQDIAMYLQEEKTSYTLKERDAKRTEALKEFSQQAEMLRQDLGVMYEELSNGRSITDDAYDSDRKQLEAAIIEGRYDDELDL